MTFKQKPWIAWLLIATGLFLLIIGGLTSDIIQLIIGGMNMFIGISMLTRDIVIITETEVQVKNLLGMTLKRFPIQGYNSHMVEGHKVFVEQDGKRVLIRALNQRGVRRQDWDRLINEVVIGQVGRSE